MGPSAALIAGDALSTLAIDVLLRTPNPAGPAAAAALVEATSEMIAGQADDLAFEARRSVSVEECMGMSTAKTGALLGCAASIGAILAGAPPTTVQALRDFGRHLGVAFQAVDDLLGIWGDPATTGKPIGNDIRQRKKSMPLVAALAAGDDEARELESILFDARPGPAAPAAAATNGHVGTGGASRAHSSENQGPTSRHSSGCPGVGANHAQPSYARRSRPGDLAGRDLRGPRVDRGKSKGPPRCRPWVPRAGPAVGCAPSRPGGPGCVRG